MLHLTFYFTLLWWATDVNHFTFINPAFLKAKQQPQIIMIIIMEKFQMSSIIYQF
jgi:hypothetical protein